MDAEQSISAALIAAVRAPLDERRVRQLTSSSPDSLLASSVDENSGGDVQVESGTSDEAQSSDPQLMIGQDNYCAACGFQLAGERYQCGGCDVMQYCSEECAKKHWGAMDNKDYNHALYCQKFFSRIDAYLEATRDDKHAQSVFTSDEVSLLQLEEKPATQVSARQAQDTEDDDNGASELRWVTDPWTGVSYWIPRGPPRLIFWPLWGWRPWWWRPWWWAIRRRLLPGTRRRRLPRGGRRSPRGGQRSPRGGRRSPRGGRRSPRGGRRRRPGRRGSRRVVIVRGETPPNTEVIYSALGIDEQDLYSDGNDYYDLYDDNGDGDGDGDGNDDGDAEESEGEQDDDDGDDDESSDEDDDKDEDD